MHHEHLKAHLLPMIETRVRRREWRGAKLESEGTNLMENSGCKCPKLDSSIANEIFHGNK